MTSDEGPVGRSRKFQVRAQHWKSSNGRHGVVEPKCKDFESGSVNLCNPVAQDCEDYSECWFFGESFLVGRVPQGV